MLSLSCKNCLFFFSLSLSMLVSQWCIAKPLPELNEQFIKSMIASHKNVSYQEGKLKIYYDAQTTYISLNLFIGSTLLIASLYKLFTTDKKPFTKIICSLLAPGSVWLIYRGAIALKNALDKNPCLIFDENGINHVTHQQTMQWDEIFITLYSLISNSLFEQDQAALEIKNTKTLHAITYHDHEFSIPLRKIQRIILLYQEAKDKNSKKSA